MEKIDYKRNGPVPSAAGDRTATVHRLLSNGSIRRRLLDMGLIEGTEIRCLYGRLSPSGDPTAFLVRGTVVALSAGMRTGYVCLQR